jgi:hypothetical protein
MSDAEWIVDWGRKHGYLVRYFMLKAEWYGSLPVRKRLFWVGLRDAIGRAAARLAHVQAVVDGTAIHRSITKLEDHLLEPHLRQVGLPDKTMSVDTSDQYKDTHFKAFKAASIDWPPTRYHSESFQAKQLTTRPFEVLHFCATVYPYDERPLDDGSWPPQYLDVQKSLEFLINVDEPTTKNPWSTRIGTLTCSCQIYVRRATVVQLADHDGSDLKLDVFQLDGLELMSMIGWDFSMYGDGCIPSHRDATKMAGNAFSGFAIAPVLGGVVAALGMFGGKVAGVPDQVLPRDTAEYELHGSDSDY